MSIRRAQDERIEGTPDGLNAVTEISDVPDAPTIASATNVGTSRGYNNGAATVTITANATGGTPTSYTVTSSPSGGTGSGTSPVTVTGLASQTSYTFTATATNSTGTGAASSASSSITATTVPQAPTIGTATAPTSTTASVPFTAGATGGSSVTVYTATSSPGSITGTNTASPITVSGLTASTAYTFTVTATNANGTSTASSASNSVTTPAPAVRGIVAGGYPGSPTNNDLGTKLASIEYINIASTGNFASFGNLSTAKDGNGNLSSSTRALFTDNATSPQVEYITIANLGNGTTFGSLINNAYGMSSGCSNETRGVIAGGYFNPGAEVMSNKMDYFTIASTGNSVAFGTLVLPRYSLTGFSSTTRGLFCGGNFNFSSGAGPCSEIEYITIASAGNATAFGDMVNDRDNTSAVSSNTRGVMATGMLDGSNISDTIDYITIATTGNATSFGSMSSTRRQQTGLSSSIRGVFTVGNVGQGPYYRVPTGNAEYITIATTGNSTDFGALVTQRVTTAGASNGHGGL